MRSRVWFSFAVFLAFAAAGPRTDAAEPALAGNWKVRLINVGSSTEFFIVQVEGDAAAPKMSLVAAFNSAYKNAKIEPGKCADGAVRFSIAPEGSKSPWKFSFYKAADGKDGAPLLGSFRFGSSCQFAKLERTDDKTIPENRGTTMSGTVQDFYKTLRMKDVKEKAAALSAIREKNPGDLMGYMTTIELLGAAGGLDASDADIRAMAESALKFAAAYGPEMKAYSESQVAQKLVASKKSPALAVEFSRKAEKALPADAKDEQRIGALKTLLAAEKQAKHQDEVKETAQRLVEVADKAEKGLPADATNLQKSAAMKTLLSALKETDRKMETAAVADRVAAMEKTLDEEFLKDAVPFKPESITREGSKGSVALIELFTGAQCPPCVAADVAFDATMQTYKPQDVILLQYHLHIPGPDPLTNEDTEERWKYYEGRGVPSTYLNGGKDLRLGGPKEHGKESYEVVLNGVKQELEGAANAKIELSAKKVKDEVVIRAAISDLKEAGEDVKLRLALVEEVVHYAGGNGQRYHHHVVRAMPGGVEGMAVKDASSKHEAKISLVDLKKKLAKYLEKADAERPFPNEDRPMEMKELKVVAFLQNDKTKKVLQAVQVDVEE
jgi:hypothetical protein